MSIRIEYSHTPSDLVEAWRAYRTQGTAGFDRFMARAYVPLGVLVCAAGIYCLAVRRFSIWYCVLVIISGMYLLTYTAIFKPYFIRREFRKDPSAQRPVTAEFDDAGIRVSYAHGKGELSWSAIILAFETPNTFVLLPSRSVYYVFPKRFYTPESVVAMRELIRRNVSSNRLDS